MKSLLFFPPFWDLMQPYLALPSLTAYLKKHNLEINQYDLNIELVDKLLTSSYLNKIAPEKKKNKYKDTINKVNWAKQILREKEFYNLKKYIEAKSILQKAFKIISDIYHPTKFSLFEYNSPYSIEIISEIIQATEDEQTNVFLPLYREELPRIINRENPNLIGISISGTYQIIPGLTLCKWIKENYPDIHLTIGGSIFTRLKDNLSKNRQIFEYFCDSIILHEGERPLFYLAKQSKENLDLSKVPNLIYKKDKTINKNPVKKPEDINNLSGPDFSNFPLDLYLTPELVLPILSTRGCYWGKCAFCDHGYIYKKNYRVKSIENLTREIRELSQKYQTNYFSFADECISPHRYDQIYTNLKDEDIYWLAESRLESQIDKQLANKIYQAGGRLIYWGLESINKQILNKMNKGIAPKSIKKVLKNTSEAGIWNSCFIFFGFPGETKSQAKQTIDFVFASSYIDSFWGGFFSLETQSLVSKYPDKFGIKIFKGKSMSLSLDYKNLSGPSRNEQLQSLKKFLTRLKKEKGNRIWRILNRAELLLYYCHHGKSLKNVTFDPQKIEVDIYYQ